MASPLVSSAVEEFVLLGIIIADITLRIHLRARAVGWKRLTSDDYLMILVAPVYSALTASAHVVVVKCKGQANDNMTAKQRASLDPASKEYSIRTIASKFELIQRVLYFTTLWLTKASMLAFCRRLTERLSNYRSREHIGFAILGATWIADFLIAMLNCRPFHKNWQINPDPGAACYPATSPYSAYGTLSLNILTSLYIFLIPLPLVWMASLRLWKKMGLIMLVSANCFVIAISILRGYLISLDTISATRQASLWSVRVCFVAVMTTNLPLLFPFMRRLLVSLCGKPARPQPQMQATTRFGETVPTNENARLNSGCYTACCLDTWVFDSRFVSNGNACTTNARDDERHDGYCNCRNRMSV
ncbi:hypothetical protein M426DRAFT_63663 [Hypoxylon sp. CI-4A]|nr:hypothetical protein M426DRAFT_63663 [Hypoxylon sp. CI-4A]